MNRRERLAQQLLGLPSSDTPLDEAKLGFDKASTELILRDFVDQILKALARRGPGIPIAGRNGAIRWHTPEDIKAQLATAEAHGDDAVAAFSRELLQAIEKLIPSEGEKPDHILFAFADSRGMRLHRLPVENPHAQIHQILQEWGH